MREYTKFRIPLYNDFKKKQETYIKMSELSKQNASNMSTQGQSTHQDVHLQRAHRIQAYLAGEIANAVPYAELDTSHELSSLKLLVRDLAIFDASVAKFFPLQGLVR